MIRVPFDLFLGIWRFLSVMLTRKMKLDKINQVRINMMDNSTVGFKRDDDLGINH